MLSTRSVRFRLLLAVNATMGALFLLFLVLDYRRELSDRVAEKRIALEEEAKTLLPGVLRVRPNGVSAVQDYVDSVCGAMQDRQSPGHHIAVRMDETTIQALAHHRASPEMFKTFIQPHYVKICQFLRANGVEIIFVDSDGYLDELIPLWLEVGINGFSPLEVAAGMDAIALRKKYGRDIVLAGNIDKRALISGRDAMDKEVEKANTLLTQGGYFPAVDHSVPPDVSYRNFNYFLQALRGEQ